MKDCKDIEIEALKREIVFLRSLLKLPEVILVFQGLRGSGKTYSSLSLQAIKLKH